MINQDLHYTSHNPGAKVEDKATPHGVMATNPSGFIDDPMMQESAMNAIVGSEKEDLWLDRDHESLLGVNEDSIFYTDFPPLPDFPCMSSSSSSSSNPKPIVSASTSSSAASSSWAATKSDNAVKMEHNNNGGGGGALSSTASMEMQPPLSDIDCCIDAMENFGYMDLIDVNEIWEDDPSDPVFNRGGDDSNDQQQQNPMVLDDDRAHQVMFNDPPPQEQPREIVQQQTPENDGLGTLLQGNSELAMIFFEWLKQNKDYISAEDMRSIKLKRSTIENASKKLGNTREGKVKLLKLILDWVEQCQLQKKKKPRENGSQELIINNQPTSYQETHHVQNTAGDHINQNPNPNDPGQNFPYNPMSNDPNACFSTPPWIQPQPQEAVPVMVASPNSYPQTVPMYPCDPYTNAVQMPPINHHQVMSNGPIPYPQYSEYPPMMDHAQPWAMPPPYAMPQPQFSPFHDHSTNIMPHQPSFYQNPYQLYDLNGERLGRLGASATKEARKKRMARQRRLFSHHNRHSSHMNHQHQSQMMGDVNLMGDQIGEDKSNQGDQAGNNWMYNWSSTGGVGTSSNVVPNVDSMQPSSGDRVAVQTQNNQRQGSSDRRQQQGLKTEKNLKFLLQKVLKQSDVGNLGRIVLPKKEAESHLPELETRDGISVAMEDIGTSRVWNMRYRFWPNNKSRMYLLENTGDFVRVNGLQEGDFIVIYSDTKCGKYMIRGVKVRPGTKLESKKPTKKNTRSLSIGGNDGSSLAQIKQAVRGN